MPLALITGASAGIGKELASLMAADDWDLVLVARNRSVLETLAASLSQEHHVQIHVIASDLSTPQAAQEIADQLRNRHLQLDALINNAGFGSHGPFVQTDLAHELSMIQVNVTSLLALTRLLLPDLLQREKAYLMNVASVAAFVPGPYMSTYYATKAFVLSHSLALSEELKGTHVSVTCLCPGPTPTNFAHRANIYEATKFKSRLLSPKQVARAGYRGMLKGKRLVIPGLSNRLAVTLTKSLPSPLTTSLVANLNRNRSRKSQ